MSDYRDGAVDPKNRVILTEDGVYRPDFPRFLQVCERIGDTVLLAGHAVFNSMAAMRYPLHRREYAPVPSAETSRGVGAVCVGACIFMIAAKLPEAAHVATDALGSAANSSSEWIDNNIAEPLSHLNDSSSWFRK